MASQSFFEEAATPLIAGTDMSPSPLLDVMIVEQAFTGLDLALKGLTVVQSQPPAMLRLYGSSNNVTIAGALVGAIPSDYQSDYTMDVVAIDEKGSGNTLTVTSTGMVIGNVVLGGANTHVRIDGTVKNDVIITGASITLEGNGRIEGRLTIDGQAVTEHGSLKIGPS